MNGIGELSNFRMLAREYDVLPTEVKAIVIGSGARFTDHMGRKIVEPADLPIVTPMLIRLSDYKRGRRLDAAS